MARAMETSVHQAGVGRWDAVRGRLQGASTPPFVALVVRVPFVFFGPVFHVGAREVHLRIGPFDVGACDWVPSLVVVLDVSHWTYAWSRSFQPCMFPHPAINRRFSFHPFASFHVHASSFDPSHASNTCTRQASDLVLSHHGFSSSRSQPLPQPLSISALISIAASPSISDDLWIDLDHSLSLDL